MLNFGLQLKDNKEYISYFIRFFQFLIGLGVGARVVYVLMRISDDETISASKVWQKISKPIYAAIFSIVLSELLRYVASYYGYFY